MSPIAPMGSSAKLVAAIGYHDVTDAPCESGFQRRGARTFKLGTARFVEHLDQIAAGPLTPCLLPDIDLSRPGRHLLLTFDDGGKSALRVGDDLCRRGWRGHFFISTALIGRRTFLTAEELRHLRRCGHLIGSHSHNHPDIYRELSWERMVVEWRQSSDILSDILGEPCTAGAVPGGDVSEEVLRSAAAAGLRYVFTSDPWPRPRVVNGTWVLGRMCAKEWTTAGEIAELVRFRGWGKQLLFRQAKNAARRCLPLLYRAYVGRSTREWVETST
jgi:peptidoglycan/xylan/chitin deacetylase (PgdA/CDA1 family)